jgi:hypothetical protein
VLILAPGLGANTAIFSLINVLNLRESPVPETRRLGGPSTINPKDQPIRISCLSKSATQKSVLKLIRLVGGKAC